VIEWTVEGPTGTADIRAAWIVRHDEVEELAEGVFEIEFSDDSGTTYAMLPLQKEKLLVLHHAPVASH